MGWKVAVPVFAIALPALAAPPAAAQTYAFVRFGNAMYADDDPFCEDPTAFLTMVSAGVSTSLAGFSVEYNNEDWPWPPPPGGGTGEFFLTHGSSLQFVAELNPARFVASGLNQYARPFVGVGLNLSTDGETATGTLPTYAVKGQTRPVVTYGVNGFLPVSSRLGVTAGYRGTSVFFGDFEIETPGGAIDTVDGKTLTSGSWNVGLSLRLGS